MLILHIIPSFSGEFHFFIHDHLGNTRVVVNESGDVVESYDYYPFGMNLRRTLSQPIGTIDTFTGKELDVELHEEDGLGIISVFGKVDPEWAFFSIL